MSKPRWIPLTLLAILLLSAQLACSLAPGGNQENVMTVLAGSELRDLEHSYLGYPPEYRG